MSPSVDPAILSALGLDASKATMTSHGGSGFASTFKLTSTDKTGQPRAFFVKTGTGPDAEVMFRGEHASLNAIQSAMPTLCPRSHAHGPLSSGRGFFLVTDFLDLRTSPSSPPTVSLANKLAKLHRKPAPVPPGHERPVFGFPVPTCCGATPQDNTFTASWAGFYAERRLRAIVRAGERANGADAELATAVERVASTVVPRLVGDDRLDPPPTPVVVHGDLWSGNRGTGTIVGGGGGVEEVVFDPSCVYAHAEYELGIMRMFGGFGAEFWREYGELVPKAEPRGEWEDRIALYELYHHLNHWTLFGGGYRGGAMSIMKKLISKYGSELRSE